MSANILVVRRSDESESQVRNRLSAGGKWIRTIGPAVKYRPFRRPELVSEGMSPKVRFAIDSPLEEAVKSEPVSEWGEFPASWENTGNSSDSGLGDAKLPAKNLKESMTSKQNSLRHGTGN
jgi:hypothetical protein